MACLTLASPAPPAPPQPGPRPAAQALRPMGDMAIAVPERWRGERDARLAAEVLRFRFAGNPSGPVLLALGGVSADRFVAHETPARPGWWGALARPGGAIDLARFCVVSADYPPAWPRGEVDLTTADFAALLRLALRAAGIERLAGLVGASFGGMIALAFARQFPDSVGRIAVLCAAHRPSPMAQAWREIQRRILRLAIEEGRPRDGVALARSLAMTSYRTPEEFAARFDYRLDGANAVGPYLAARGEDYAAKMTAYRYLALSSAIDRHDERPEEIAARALLIAADSDRLVPLTDVLDMQKRLAGRARLVVLNSRYGHDAFLKETAAIAPHLDAFLKEI